MKLANLLDADVAAPPGSGDLGIEHVSCDSRDVRPGTLFVALAGTRADGAGFARDAVARGAVVVLAAEDAVLDALGVPVLRAPDPRRALALAAARFFARQPGHIAAVTGTNGKTSVAEFARQILAQCGCNAASVGTIGIVKSDGPVYGSLTTPDPVTLHRTLAELADQGITHLAMEASSHGLDQRRLDGVQIAAAAYTNLGRDHLDYHPTVEDYFRAKLRLFDTLLPAAGVAVVNADDARADAVVAAVRARRIAVLTTGRQGSDIALEALSAVGFKQRVRVRHAGRSCDLTVPLLGDYQVSNALVAAGLAIALGADATRAIGAIEGLTTVNGRLDVVGEVRGGLIVVDYAHKPEALAAALDALRPFATGRLICLFGCGGDRDKGKRPIMGEIATRKSDIVIVTDDNPRSEPPARIRAEILAAAPGAREIGDRAEAIGAAVAMMGPGDVVLVAGKGHESGQIVGSTVIPFSDHAAVRAAMQRG